MRLVVAALLAFSVVLIAPTVSAYPGGGCGQDGPFAPGTFSHIDASCRWVWHTPAGDIPVMCFVWNEGICYGPP